jgi:hypothetical protein
MKIPVVKQYELIVVGGGLSGMCAAIAAARHGVKTALIQNRPVLGGNNSSEIRMHMGSAVLMGQRPDARETGLIEEFQEVNRARNPNHCWSIYDTVLWEITRFQKGLDLYLNTHMTEVRVADGMVRSIRAEQLTTEKVFEFTGPLFVDATGDGTLGALAGAEYMSGREGKDVFGERFAPDQSDKSTMGNTLMFKAKDVGRPVTFEKPIWANTYTEEQLRLRDHSNIGAGYWWIELGGQELNALTDGEEIRDELLKAVYGVWDHIKNGGDHGAATWDLDWVQFLPGKRESRRLLGDYVLKEKDILEQPHFADAVGYGGWSIDLHAMGGLRNSEEEGATQHLKAYTPKDVYCIPYRCLYSRNIRNLFLGGRAISVSHVAFGSTRQMAQCAILGQAVGTAGAMALRRNVLPRDVLSFIGELQQALLKDDCYIPGVRNEDLLDRARTATITCSSHVPDGEAANVINGVARRVGSAENAWISESPAEGQWLCLNFDKRILAREIRLTFDPDLSHEIKISLAPGTLARQSPGMPRQLVKRYRLDLLRGGEVVHQIEMTKSEYPRHRIHTLPKAVLCDQVKLTVLATYGDTQARVFEVRVYE